MRLQVGENNNVVVTVTELTTIDNPYYLFEFITLTNVPYRTIRNGADNISTETQRYDEFTGFDNIQPHTVGTGIYKIYQQTSDTNLDPTLSQGLVETGIVEVFANPTEITNKTYNASITNKVYNG